MCYTGVRVTNHTIKCVWCMRECMFVCACVRVGACACVCRRVCMHVCVCVTKHKDLGSPT